MAAGKEKKLICGLEEEIVVAHGRLPSPAPTTGDSGEACIKWQNLSTSNVQRYPFNIFSKQGPH